MQGFSSRFKVKKRHKLLWAIALVVVALAVAVLWFMSAGKRALISRISTIARETPLGNLDFQDVETTVRGVVIIEPRLTQPETGRLIAEARKAVLGITLQDLLQSRGEIASITVTIHELRVYPEYTADGHWDLEELLRKAPEEGKGKLRELHIILHDARVKTALDADARENLSSYIESLVAPHRARAGEGLADWLNKTGVNLQPSFADDLRRLIGSAALEAPDNLELAVDGRLDLGLQRGSVTGDLKLAAPFPGSLKFGWSRETGSGEINLSTSANELRLSGLKWLPLKTSFWDLSDTTANRFELKLALKAESPVKVVAARGQLGGVKLFPHRSHELLLKSGEMLFDGSVLRSSVDLSAGEAGVYLNSDSSREIAAEVMDLPLHVFVADVDGVSASRLDGNMQVRLPSSALPDLAADGKLELAGVSFHGTELPGSVRLAGNLEGGSASGTVAWLVDGRRLAQGRVSGDSSRLRGDADLKLRRGDIPTALVPRESIPSWIKEVRIELAALFDMEQRSFAGRTSRAEVTMEDGRAEVLAASFELKPGFFLLTMPQLELFPSYPAEAVYRKYAPERVALSASIRGSAESGGWRIRTEGRGNASFAGERVYFDIAGGGSPEHLALEVNSGGVLLDEPLSLSARLSLEPRRLAVSELDIHYASSRITGEGDYAFADSSIRFAYGVSDLPLHLWVPSIPVLDPVDASGVIRGTIHQPVVRVASFSGGIGVDVGGNRISAQDVSLQGVFENGEFCITEGSAQVGGELLFFDGTLGGNRFFLRATADECSLFGMVPRFVPELNFPAAGEGELQLKLHGSYTDPRYKLHYRQMEGSLAGERIGRLELELHGDAGSLEIAKAHLSMGAGSLDAQGAWQFGKEGEDEWSVTVKDFPVAPLAYAYEGLEKLEAAGFVSGQIQRSAGETQTVSQGYFVLEDGVMLGTSVDAAEIAFNIQPAGIYIDKLELSTPEYLISASGFWSREPGETSISVNVPYMDLALLSPLLPENLQPLSGKMGFISEVTRDEAGAPVLVGSFLTADESGLRAGMFAVDSIRGMLEIAHGAIRLKATLVQSDESEMVLDGVVPFPGTSEEFEMAVHAENFSLEFLRPFMKESQWDCSGRFTAELNVGGTWSAPRLTGPVKVELDDIAFNGSVVLARVAGDIELDCESRLDDARSDGECVQSAKVNMNLYPNGGDTDGTPRNFARVTGSAKLAPDSRELDSVDVSVDLANLDRVEVAGLFKGGLSGSLTVTKSFAAQPISLTGEIAVRPGATLKLPTLAALEPMDYGVEVMLGDYDNPLKVTVGSDCWVRYAPLMMEVALNGELMVSGTAGDPRLEGELTAPRGSLVLLNRIVRLTGPATIKVGLEEEYDYGRMPHLFGTAAVELPGALASSHGELPVEILPSDLPLAPTEEDLTVYFGFHDMQLDALADEQNFDEINMYSEPPLSRQAIMVYLLGGQALDVSPTGLQTFLGSEALAFSGSRLSRFLEESLDFKRFEIRALSSDEGTPFYINMEKEFAPQFSMSYLRTFLEEVDERQEVSGKFYFDERYGAKTYVELMWRRRGQEQEEIVGNLGFNFRF
ncbi:hypothetical protein J7J84_05690 [bacterium]|nr:hypothetical protein [bacterium]